MTLDEGSRLLVRRGLERVHEGNRSAGLDDLRSAVAMADRNEGTQDQVASRLVLADVLGGDPDVRRVLEEAHSIAVGADDAFGVASVSAHLGVTMVDSDPLEAAALLRGAVEGFRAIEQREALASVLVTLVGVLPDDGEAHDFLVELRELVPALDSGDVVGATASVRWCDRLLRHGNAAEALPGLVDAHEVFVDARDGEGAISAGLRMNEALLVLHESWPRFPLGEQLVARFEVPVDEMEVPAGESHVMVGWNFDPRDLPITARHFPPHARTNGWVLWSGQEPFELPGYLPVTTDEVIRWLPQVRPYLELPPGWAFQIAPDHEDVWEEPELLEDDT